MQGCGKMRKIDLKRKEADHWIRTSLLPLIIGFSLIVSKISMIVFQVIGWILFVWGVGTGYLYLFKLYKENKEEVQDVLSKLHLLKAKKKQEDEE